MPHPLLRRPKVCSKHSLRLVPAAALIFFVAQSEAGEPPAPTAAPEKGTFFYPTGPGPGRIRVVVGASVDVLPRKLVESEQRQVPRLTGGIRWGLPYGFSLDGRASAIVLSNELQAGLSWSWATDHLAIGVHARSGLWFGTLGVEGFDATGTGILSTPGLSFGVPLRETRLSLGIDALIVQAQSITVGDSNLRRNRLSVEGVAVPFVVESLLPHGGAFYYGVTLIWARPDYQLWLAFSDSRARQLYPRFVAGYEF